MMFLNGCTLYPFSTASYHTVNSLNKISYDFEAVHPTLVSLNQNQDVNISIFFSRIDKIVSIHFVVQLLNYTH